jgi:hypothetical protein
MKTRRKIKNSLRQEIKSENRKKLKSKYQSVNETRANYQWIKTDEQ